jgi:hypothetical protein
VKAQTVRPLWLAVALALAVSSPVLGDAPQSFKDGIRAFDYGKWPELVSAMRRAIAEQPRATGDNVKIYGMNFAPYIPHYFLGLGLYRQGDCKGAREAFDQAEAQGTTRGLYRARMEFLQDLCAQKLGVARGRVQTASVPPASSSQSSTGQRRNPGTRPPSPVPVAPSQPSTPPGPALPPDAVRKKALAESVREGQQWVSRGQKLIETINQRRRADPRKFDRDPTRAEILDFAGPQLKAAAYRLESCQREGDVDGAERAREDAEATWGMLEELLKGL